RDRRARLGIVAPGSGAASCEAEREERTILSTARTIALNARPTRSTGRSRLSNGRTTRSTGRSRGLNGRTTRPARPSTASRPPPRSVGVAAVSMGAAGGWTYAVTPGGLRMSVKRKSHNIDETLLRRAKRVLGASTETEAIHGALRAVLIGDEILRDLEAARG